MHVLPDGLPATLTPPELARILRVDPCKVIGWILAGELAGFDVSATPGGRPRYRIPREAAEDFVRMRGGAAVSPKPPKRRPKTAKKYLA